MDINQGEIILSEMQGCFQEMDLPLMLGIDQDNYSSYKWLGINSWIKNELYLANVSAGLQYSSGFITLQLHIHPASELIKQDVTLRFLNMVNCFSLYGFWYFNPVKAEFVFQTGMAVTEKSFDRNQFMRTLRGLLTGAESDYPLIMKEINLMHQG